MKQIILIVTLAIFFGTSSYAQKMVGVGGELSVISFKPNVRMWFSKTTGFELFGGMSAEFDDIKPDDPEAGFKYLHAIQYSRSNRTYIGVVGKWKWVDVFESNRTTSLPEGGLLIGKEWYDKRVKRKAFAVELGYQYGNKEYNVYSPVEHIFEGKEIFAEFPLILNFRYSLMSKKR
jgi:hypothetical protein